MAGGVAMESEANPMRKDDSAPRCTAKSKRTGQPCKSPAVRGWQVCRMQGAHGGAGSGKGHPNYQHGTRSREAIEPEGDGGGIRQEV